ncbi:hypothetical protein [Rothia koreensis]|uniref:hypothetical protein n=1 Tax=Rothia koreensis TaxID=592378 RepID=UPI003FCCD19D
MSLKLIAVENYARLADVGTCDLCYGSMWVEEPVYVFQDADTGETKHINGYLWSWGDYFDLLLDNIPSFAEWVQHQPDLTLDQLEDFGDLQQLVYRMDEEADE